MPNSTVDTTEITRLQDHLLRLMWEQARYHRAKAALKDAEQHTQQLICSGATPEQVKKAKCEEAKAHFEWMFTWDPGNQRIAQTRSAIRAAGGDA